MVRAAEQGASRDNNEYISFQRSTASPMLINAQRALASSVYMTCRLDWIRNLEDISMSSFYYGIAFDTARSYQDNIKAGLEHEADTRDAQLPQFFSKSRDSRDGDSTPPMHYSMMPWITTAFHCLPPHAPSLPVSF
jgi:hypothetical protein